MKMGQDSAMRLTNQLEVRENGEDETMTSDTTHLQALIDRISIQDVVSAVTIYSDLGNPEAALAQFSDDAMVDYSSVLPGTPLTPVKEHRARIWTFLPGFDKRQHQVTNFQVSVDGDEAICISQCRAVHFLGEECWEAWATYHHKLRRTSQGWKITYQRADFIYQTGEHLVPLAEKIVAERSAS
jgi:ketosteroid isomerase-like protein